MTAPSPLSLDLRVLAADNNGSGDKEILTPELIQCGYRKWSLFQTAKDEGNFLIEFVDRIPLKLHWPLALIENLEIDDQYRRKGYGRKGLREMISEAKANGAVCAILRVGWNPNECAYEARQWKTKFYKSEGFKEQDYDKLGPVIMYRDLA